MANMMGCAILAKREIMRYVVVVQQTLLPPLVTSLLFMFIFGLSVGKNIRSDAFESSYLSFIIPGLLTMHLISSSFENTSSSLFISRWHNHIQEILLSPLSYLEMVIGLWVGGMSRGIITALGVYAVSLFFEPIAIHDPLFFIYFMITITTIFSCLGMIVALWADNFGMLSVWNIYLITPAVFLGGVFNPIQMLPEPIQFIAKCNPMLYLVDGMRYSMTGVSETPIGFSTFLSLAICIGVFCWTVALFRAGYKLRV